MNRNASKRRPNHVLICIFIAHAALTFGTASHAADLVQEAVDQVSLSQYKMYQVDVESMGLGLYGGPEYNQGYRNRDGWLGGGSLGNAEATLYLADQLIAMGLDVVVQGDYANVVGELTGSTRPKDVYIVCAHYDSTTGQERPGGDDNASGTAGVLEAARVLTQYQADATLRFIAFNAEEDWMLGSEDYVLNVVMPSDDNLIGVLNLDMILRPAWDVAPDAIIDLDIATDESPECLAWVDTFVSIAAAYTPSLVIDADSPNTTYWYASDQGPFLWNGYVGLMLSEGTAEEIWSGSNAYYHSAEDASDGLANDPKSPSGVTYDYGFATDVVRATVATLADQAGIVATTLPTFQQSQSIEIDGAADLEFFTLDGEAYLAVAQDGNDVTSVVDSTLYQWDGSAFVEFQRVATNGARDWEFFTIGDEAYLAVANAGDDATHQVDSKIYRWNGDGFVEHQSLPTQGATDCAFFSVAEDHYLAIANAQDDTTADVNSTIYQWTGTRFDAFQSIPTHGAADCEVFTVAGDAFLAIANAGDDQTYNVDSLLYKWNGTGFVEFQAIPTSGASDWEYFTIGADGYLMVANAYDGVTAELNSTLYKWDGTAFAPLQSIPTYAAANWMSFTLDDIPHLAVANANDQNSPDGAPRVYRWNGTRFVESAAISAPGARAGAFFTLDGTPCLGLTQTASEAAPSGLLTFYEYR